MSYTNTAHKHGVGGLPHHTISFHTALSLEILNGFYSSRAIVTVGNDIITETDKHTLKLSNFHALITDLEGRSFCCRSKACERHGTNSGA